ncbi:MAG: DUF3244 domain-containing protein [Bacteroidales bacterium]|nr:DUF3244 domain-containing protein [Bacteroidales bacterium]
MNAKKLLLLFLLAIGLSGMCGTTDPPPTGADRIELKGLLDINHGPNDVEAYADQNFVYIYFHQNFGYVSVTIYGPNGLIVYSDVVNTAVQQQVIIPITGFIDGVYSVVLESVTGYADGEFEKNNSN